MSEEPLLWMTNPGIPGIESQVTTQEAFDEIWEAKGWMLIPYGTEPFVPPRHLTEADIPTVYNDVIPWTGDKIIHVSPRGSDLNDGLTAKKAKLTLAAAFAALGGAGTIQLEAGVTVLSSTFTISSANGVVLRGRGYNSEIRVTSNLSGPAVVLTDSSRSRIENLRISVNTGGTVTHGLHITRTAGSTEQVDVRNVVVTALTGGTMTNAFAVGADTASDVADITFYSCRAEGASNAGFQLGNGTNGNVLNIRMFGCVSKTNLYGVNMTGAVMCWYGGTTQGNDAADFKLVGPSTAPISIDGVRSENSTRLWECTTNGTAARQISIRNVSVPDFDDVDGKVVVHNASHPLTLEDCRFTGTYTVAMDITASGTNPGVLNATNVITNADAPFGPLTNVKANIRGLRKIEAVTGKLVPVSTGDVAQIGEALKIVGNVGFNGTTPPAKPTVTGSRGGNAALTSLLTQLASLGLITDSTS